MTRKCLKGRGKKLVREKLFNMVQNKLEECVRILNLDENVCEILRHPLRELHVSIPVCMDDGSVRVFRGFRVQHNDALGPAKGGVRFHPEETIDTIRSLAIWMTLKCSLLGLPLGGGKGGVICNPKEMSKGELERLSRGYVRQVWQFIGPDKDIPAPDVYTNPQIMAWMMDEYSKISQRSQFAVITGKPLVIGGTVGRSDATARGGMYVLREAADICGVDLEKAIVAIQGYGNAGYHAASLASSLYGCKIVAVSDTKGGIYNDRGLDPKKVFEHKVETGSVTNYPGAKNISNGELLELDVDVLCPAALENVITRENAGNIKARIIVELANGPTTIEGDKILYHKGIHVLPDFLCNAGGVTVSYFEMVQNFSMYYWDLEEVHQRLDKKMTKAYYEVLEASNKYNINMRQAACVVSVKRIAEAMKFRGWI
jgi:glutamate dehydrogenase (NAD(P)+)